MSTVDDATRCRNGHEFTPENTYAGAGYRTCRRCNAAAQARRRERQGPRPTRPRKPRATTPLSERFWAKVEISDECWQWTASLAGSGYGQIRDDEGKILKAHRVSYELRYGPIPDGMILDHTCWNRGCVNPEHLRVVTYKQNNEHLQGPKSLSVTGVRGVGIRGPRNRASAVFVAQWRTGTGRVQRSFGIQRLGVEVAAREAVRARNEGIEDNYTCAEGAELDPEVAVPILVAEAVRSGYVQG